MLKRRRILCGILGGFLFVALTAAGCGKKADPIPPRLISPPAIADLSADSVTEGILLSWSTPGPKGRIAHFRILRSEGNADQMCPGCPQEYRPLATLKANDRKIRREEENGFHYMDTAVAEGRIYSYRISACDFQGQCGEPSAPAQLLLKRR
ncbi:MAG: hypothetical protein JXL20_10105 [Deltaproteobacteria bacterium]|nr:hypothetical protein [Deltaproteobacteria bacterium]